MRGRRRCTRAFRDDDLDVGSLDPAEAAARINRRVIRDDLLAALADWSNITTNKQDKERLRGVLKAADPDPASFRNRWNAASERNAWTPCAGWRRVRKRWSNRPSASCCSPAD